MNYFEHVKELVLGDIIIYKIKDLSKTYKVTISTIIDEDDWSYLEESKLNKITLITCVENKPEKRRCIQAEEI